MKKSLLSLLGGSGAVAAALALVKGLMWLGGFVHQVEGLEDEVRDLRYQIEQLKGGRP